MKTESAQPSPLPYGCPTEIKPTVPNNTGTKTLPVNYPQKPRLDITSGSAGGSWRTHGLSMEEDDFPDEKESRLCAVSQKPSTIHHWGCKIGGADWQVWRDLIFSCKLLCTDRKQRWRRLRYQPWGGAGGFLWSLCWCKSMCYRYNNEEAVRY